MENSQDEKRSWPRIFTFDAGKLRKWGPIRDIFNWARAWSLWSVHLSTGCCSPEMMALACARFDAERFGTLPFPSVRECDLIFVLGLTTEKMAKRLKMTYDQMPEPKYVIACGNCSLSGGLFWDSYSVVQGVDKLIPIDVYVPGCPPRPEAWIQGLQMLQKKIRDE